MNLLLLLIFCYIKFAPTFSHTSQQHPPTTTTHTQSPRTTYQRMLPFQTLFRLIHFRTTLLPLFPLFLTLLLPLPEPLLAHTIPSRLDHPISLNNRATHIQPDPLPNQRAEMSIRRATTIFPAADISAGISKELGKHFQTYKSLKLIPRSSIEDKAVFLRSQMFLKKNQTASLQLGSP